MNKNPLTLAACLLAALIGFASFWVTLSRAQCIPGQSCPAPSITAPNPLLPLVPLPKPRPHPAVVRIVNVLGQERCYASGTLVGRATVITCAHTFRDGLGQVDVVFADGRRCAARVVAVDPIWDLAALEIPAVDVVPVAIAAAAPRPGQWLTSCGWGPREAPYACNRGQALGYIRADRQPTCETLELTGSARGGDSGGPVLDEQGRLVAVLWGTDGRTVGATYCGRVQKFLDRVLGRPQEQEKENTPIAAGPPATPPALSDPLEALRARLDRLQTRLDTTHGRLDKLTGGLARLDQAVEAVRKRANRSQSSTPAVRKVAREVALGVLAEHVPSLIDRLLPGLLAALGWTGPPAVVAVMAMRILATRWSRKVQQNKPAAKTLHDDYAKQLSQVYALSGHSPTADATLGREYDEALRLAETSSDGTLAAWAKKLRERVAQKFYRIHGEAPAPADPVRDD